VAVVTDATGVGVGSSQKRTCQPVTNSYLTYNLTASNNVGLSYEKSMLS